MAFICFLYTIPSYFFLQNSFYSPSINHFSLPFSQKWLLFHFYQPFLLASFSKMAFIRLLSTISPRFFLQNGFYSPSMNHFFSLLSPKWLLHSFYQPLPLSSSPKSAFIQPLSATSNNFFPENSPFLPLHIKKDSTHIEYCLTLLPLLRIFFPTVQAC